jgi:hypothetical protein
LKVFVFLIALLILHFLVKTAVRGLSSLRWATLVCCRSDLTKSVSYTQYPMEWESGAAEAAGSLATMLTAAVFPQEN